MRAPSRRPRVAVSGAAGTGKTTLGGALASSLGVPFLVEGMRERLEQGLDLHSLSRDAHRELVATLLGEMAEQMRDSIERAGGFVVDRSPLDLAAFWLYYGFGFDERATDAFVSDAVDAAAMLDGIVLLPLGVFALEADGVRTANRWVQTHYASVLEHFLGNAPCPVLRLDRRLGTPEQRLQHVLESLPGRCG